LLTDDFINKVKDSFINLFDGKSITSIAVPYDNSFSSDVLSHLHKGKKRFFHWTQVNLNFCFTAIDSIFDVAIDGNNRLTKSSNQIDNLKINHNWAELKLNQIPLFTGGIKFTQDQNNSIWNDYHDSDWFIPKFILLSINNKNFLVFNFANDASLDTLQNYFSEIKSILNPADECHDDLINYVPVNSVESEMHERMIWSNKVNEALEKIDKGLAQKIVLSREVVFHLESDYCLVPILNHLKSKFKRCYIFAYRKDSSIFFGASPEKLAKISSGWIEADALAGSIKRGKTKEEDDQLADSLLNSQKNISEQKAVVDFIANSFNSFSDEVIYEPLPVIRKLENIQHLWTNIRAKLNGNYSIFELLKEIHPTPAICGVPWNNALQFIKELEDHSRGFFAGVIGWFNFESEAEFAVAIRSALIKNKELYAFAGCGIVKGSDPIDEFEETKLKLNAILSILNHEKIYQS